MNDAVCTISDVLLLYAADDFASVGGDSPTSSVASSGASAYNSAASLPGSMVCAPSGSELWTLFCFCVVLGPRHGISGDVLMSETVHLHDYDYDYGHDDLPLLAFFELIGQLRNCRCCRARMC